ncbi:MAG: NAD(P)H-binding protein [Bacteroidota bacterium]|nr:NAD(P)H-binding protein [Bacteroidota bacterium]
MKNVIIIGGSGNIAGYVIDILINNVDVNLTLFVRNKNRLKNLNPAGLRIIEGNVFEIRHKVVENAHI